MRSPTTALSAVGSGSPCVSVVVASKLEGAPVLERHLGIRVRQPSETPRTTRPVIADDETSPVAPAGPAAAPARTLTESAVISPPNTETASASMTACALEEIPGCAATLARGGAHAQDRAVLGIRRTRRHPTRPAGPPAHPTSCRRARAGHLRRERRRACGRLVRAGRRQRDPRERGDRQRHRDR